MVAILVENWCERSRIRRTTGLRCCDSLFWVGYVRIGILDSSGIMKKLGSLGSKGFFEMTLVRGDDNATKRYHYKSAHLNS